MTNSIKAAFSALIKTLSKLLNSLLRFIPEKYRRGIKFILSSLLSFIIDYLGRLIFGIWLNGKIANILARFISAPVNFFVNQKAVFKGDETTIKAAVKYALLALFVLAADTVINEYLFVDTLKIPVWIAKPVTETLMFCFSYVIQKLFVYRKRS